MTSRAFPYHRTFPCWRFEKRDSPYPWPLLFLCKGLSGLLWDQEDGRRPGIESLVVHPQQEPLLSPRLQTCVQTATCYFPLYIILLTLMGGREGRAMKKGLPMIIARYMKECSSLDLWAITHWWGTWVSGLISSGSQSKTKMNSIRKKETNCQCQGRLIPDCWNEFTRVCSVPLQSFWTRQLSRSYCWQTYWSTYWYFD